MKPEDNQKANVERPARELLGTWESVMAAEGPKAIEAGLTHVYRLTGTAEVELRPAEPIKLLEVNEYTVPSGK